MTTNDLMKGLFAALLLASPIAGAESQYPAADFEPVIISQDADLIAKHNQAAKERALAKPEAAGSIAQQGEPSPSAEQTSPDVAGAKESLLAGNYPIVLIVLALGVYVFWSTKRSGPRVQPQESSSHFTAPSGGTAGETGVARYLKNLPQRTTVAETGVAKYVKNLAASAKAATAETGVAKYVKNLPPPAKAAAETGVAKYLKSQA